MWIIWSLRKYTVPISILVLNIYNLNYIIWQRPFPSGTPIKQMKKTFFIGNIYITPIGIEKFTENLKKNWNDVPALIVQV